MIAIRCQLHFSNVAVTDVEADINTAFNILHIVKWRDLTNIKEIEYPEESLKFLPIRVTSLTPKFTANILGELKKTLQFGSKVMWQIQSFLYFHICMWTKDSYV